MLVLHLFVLFFVVLLCFSRVLTSSLFFVTVVHDFFQEAAKLYDILNVRAFLSCSSLSLPLIRELLGWL